MKFMQNKNKTKKCNWDINVFNLYFWTLPWKSNDNQNVNVLKSLDNMDFIKAHFNIFFGNSRLFIQKMMHVINLLNLYQLQKKKKRSKITKVQNYSSITYCLTSLFWHKTVYVLRETFLVDKCTKVQCCFSFQTYFVYIIDKWWKKRGRDRERWNTFLYT